MLVVEADGACLIDELLPPEVARETYEEKGPDGKRAHTVQEIAGEFGRAVRPDPLPAPGAEGLTVTSRPQRRCPGSRRARRTPPRSPSSKLRCPFLVDVADAVARERLDPG